MAAATPVATWPLAAHAASSAASVAAADSTARVKTPGAEVRYLCNTPVSTKRPARRSEDPPEALAVPRATALATTATPRVGRCGLAAEGAHGYAEHLGLAPAPAAWAPMVNRGAGQDAGGGCASGGGAAGRLPPSPLDPAAAAAAAAAGPPGAMSQGSLVLARRSRAHGFASAGNARSAAAAAIATFGATPSTPLWPPPREVRQAGPTGMTVAAVLAEAIGGSPHRPPRVRSHGRAHSSAGGGGGSVAVAGYRGEQAAPLGGNASAASTSVVVAAPSSSKERACSADAAKTTGPLACTAALMKAARLLKDLAVILPCNDSLASPLRQRCASIAAQAVAVGAAMEALPAAPTPSGEASAAVAGRRATSAADTRRSEPARVLQPRVLTQERPRSPEGRRSPTCPNPAVAVAAKSRTTATPRLVPTSQPSPQQAAQQPVPSGQKAGSRWSKAQASAAFSSAAGPPGSTTKSAPSLSLRATSLSSTQAARVQKASGSVQATMAGSRAASTTAARQLGLGGIGPTMQYMSTAVLAAKGDVPLVSPPLGAALDEVETLPPTPREMTDVALEEEVFLSGCAPPAAAAAPPALAGQLPHPRSQERVSITCRPDP